MATGMEAEMARFEEEVLGNEGPDGNMPDLPPPPFMQQMNPPPMQHRFERNDNYNDEPFYNNGPDRRFDGMDSMHGPGPIRGPGPMPGHHSNMMMGPGPGPMPGHHSDMMMGPGPGPMPGHHSDMMMGPGPMPGHHSDMMMGPGPGPMPGHHSDMMGPPMSRMGHGPMMPGPRPMPGPQMIGPGIPSSMRPIGPSISSPPVIIAQPKVYAAAPLIMKPPQIAKNKRKAEAGDKSAEDKTKRSSLETKSTVSKEIPKNPAPTPSMSVMNEPRSGPSGFGAPMMQKPVPVSTPQPPTQFNQATAASGYNNNTGVGAKVPKKKKFIRTAAGQSWEDQTLQEWDPNDYRLFCGDLGNEVTDDVLARVFNKYTSFQKAKVVRERNSKKSKGYGFVSFKDPNDFIRAMREMNGKYVGNRPIKLRKSNWKDRNIEVVRKKFKEKKKLGYKV